MAASKWWVGFAAAVFLAVSGPVFADEAEDEDVAGEDSSAAADAVYEFLVAEVAAQRGDIDGALSIFHRLARELRDPQIARRAVETAFRARAFGPALESATLLLELEPDSTLAREIMAALLANDGDIAKARTQVAAILEKSANRPAVLMQLSHLYGKFPDKAAVLEATRAVTVPYASMPESHWWPTRWSSPSRRPMRHWPCVPRGSRARSSRRRSCASLRPATWCRSTKHS
jgi:tetratricopeptide (TPR) repeat protein